MIDSIHKAERRLHLGAQICFRGHGFSMVTFSSKVILASSIFSSSGKVGELEMDSDLLNGELGVGVDVTSMTE